MELFDELKKDLKLKPYLPIIRDKPRYPVFYDENKTVLSLPPIINSEATKISPESRNIFVEITGTDYNRCRIALAILVSQFSQYCDVKDTVEAVKVINADGSSTLTPELKYHEFVVEVDYVNKRLGIQLSRDEQIACCEKMGHFAEARSHDTYNVRVPPV